MNENWISGKIKIGIYQSEMLIIVEDSVWSDFSTFFFSNTGISPVDSGVCSLYSVIKMMVRRIHQKIHS